MAQVTNCMECGKQVSSASYRCPHCDKFPHPVRCKLCRKEGKASEVDIREGWSVREGIHTSCLQRHIAQNADMRSFSCEACSKSFNYDTLKLPTASYSDHDWAQCDNCGQPFYFYKCKICSRPVVLFDSSSKYSWHNSCFELDNRLRQELYEKTYGKKKKENCYVATACYGSYDAPEVLVLRKYRNEKLAAHSIGKLFIRLYYRYSPYLADKLQRNPMINSWIRKYLLDRIVSIIKSTDR